MVWGTTARRRTKATDNPHEIRGRRYAHKAAFDRNRFRFFTRGTLSGKQTHDNRRHVVARAPLERYPHELLRDHVGVVIRSQLMPRYVHLRTRTSVN